MGTGSQNLSILGAGAVGFGTAPLQHAAERLAEKAAPAVQKPSHGPPTPIHDRPDAYRRVVQLALRARTLIRDDERDLLKLAHHLHITAPRAIEIYDELEGATSELS